MSKREHRLYPTKCATDLTNARLAAIASPVTITSPKGRHPTDINLRAIVNALLSKNRTAREVLYRSRFDEALQKLLQTTSLFLAR